MVRLRDGLRAAERFIRNAVGVPFLLAGIALADLSEACVRLGVWICDLPLDDDFSQQ